MAKKDVQGARSFLENLLALFGLLPGSDSSTLIDTQFCIAPLARTPKGRTPKHFTVFVKSNDIGHSLVDRFVENDVTIFIKDQKRNPGMFEVAISQLTLLWEKTISSSNKIEASSVLIPMAIEPVVQKTKEQEIIEKLFAIAHIGIAEISGEEGELYVAFASEDESKRAVAILIENQVEFVGDGTIMYISLSLKDELLNGLIKNENHEDKELRHVQEHMHRLRFILERTLGIKIKAPTDKLRNETAILLSGQNGSKRVDFFSIKHCDEITVELKKAGFFCSPIQGQKNSIMVDLTKSKMIVMQTQQVDTTITNSTYTVAELRKKLVDAGFVPSSQSKPKDDVQFAFADAGITKQAYEIIRTILPDVSIKRRSLVIPNKYVAFGVRSSSTKNAPIVVSPIVPEVISEDVVVPGTEVTTHSMAHTLITLIKREVLESLDNKAADLVNDNYVIPKAGSEFIELDISDILMQGGKVSLKRSFLASLQNV